MDDSRATLSFAPVATRTRHRTPQRCHQMGSLLPWQGHHDLTVEKNVETIFSHFIFTCTQYWIIPCLWRAANPKWANVGCNLFTKDEAFFKIGCHISLQCGVKFFVFMGLDCCPPVYREAGCHTGFHSAGSQLVAPLCRPTFGGTFGKDEPDHLFFWRQTSNITCFSKVSHQSLYLVIKYIGTIQKLKGLRLHILVRYFFILHPFHTNRQCWHWITDLFMTLPFSWLLFKSILHQLKRFTVKERMYFHFPNLNHLWKFFRLSFIPTWLTLSLGMA